MSNSTTTTSGGSWQVLILDRSADDPKWILCAVVLPSDVRPAVLDAAGRYTGWRAIAGWVANVLGHPVSLVPVHDALAWHVRRDG